MSTLSTLMKRLIAILALLAATVAIAVSPAASPALADVTVCEKFGSTTIQSGRYVVQNNVWGDDTLQCINVTSTGFSITTASHNKPTNGSPGAYPSVYFGCHYANCSSGSGLPMQATNPAFNNLNTSVNMTLSSSGVWNASYDIWLDPTPRTDGQNTGAEIMIWLARLGPIQPVGSQVGTVNLNGATWQVWFGNIGWNVVSYVRTSNTNTLSFNVNSFFSDAVSRGYAQRAWYLTSIQAGFEPWVGQTGLGVNTFSVTSGGGGDTTPPSTPANLAASGVTSSSVNLSWSPSTDNVGVTGYDIIRNGSVTNTVTGTSTTVSGLTPSTSYQFAVRARDAAGNTSGNSNTVTVMTLPGTGGGGCSATLSVPSSWGGGYVADIRVTNTGSSTINVWTVTFTLPSGQTITNFWNANISPSSGAVTARSMSYNGTLAPNASTTFGFQASRPSGTALPTNFTCTAS